MRSSTSRPPVSVDACRRGVSSPKTACPALSHCWAAIGSPAMRFLAMTVSRAMRITWSDSTGVSRPPCRRRLRVVAGMPSTLATSFCVEPTAATSFSSATNGKPQRTRDSTSVAAVSPAGHANRDRTSASRGTAAGPTVAVLSLTNWRSCRYAGWGPDSGRGNWLTIWEFREAHVGHRIRKRAREQSLSARRHAVPNAARAHELQVPASSGVAQDGQ